MPAKRDTGGHILTEWPFCHVKSAIEHKRRYAHRFSNPADGKNHSFDDPLELCMAVLHRF